MVPRWASHTVCETRLLRFPVPPASARIPPPPPDPSFPPIPTATRDRIMEEFANHRITLTPPHQPQDTLVSEIFVSESGSRAVALLTEARPHIGPAGTHEVAHVYWWVFLSFDDDNQRWIIDHPPTSGPIPRSSPTAPSLLPTPSSSLSPAPLTPLEKPSNVWLRATHHHPSSPPYAAPVPAPPPPHPHTPRAAYLVHVDDGDHNVGETRADKELLGEDGEEEEGGREASTDAMSVGISFEEDEEDHPPHPDPKQACWRGVNLVRLDREIHESE